MHCIGCDAEEDDTPVEEAMEETTEEMGSEDAAELTAEARAEDAAERTTDDAKEETTAGGCEPAEETTENALLLDCAAVLDTELTLLHVQRSHPSRGEVKHSQ